MWVDQLISEYEQGRKELYSMKAQLGESELDQMDKSKINSMIGDMSYSIEWMKLGRRPGNLRGIDQRAIYQRTSFMDMDLFASENNDESDEISERTKKMLVDLLIGMSRRERQCYLLHMAQGWSMQEIAEDLGISKPSVQKFIDRAKVKIKRKLSYEMSYVKRNKGEGVLR